MIGYRVYLLDPFGHIRSVLELECQDDADAMNLASAKATTPYEVWQGARLVGKLDVRPPQTLDPRSHFGQWRPHR